MLRIFILILLIIGCSEKKDAKDTWLKFTSKEGGFSIEHPNFNMTRDTQEYVKEDYGKVSDFQYELKPRNQNNLKYNFRWLNYHESSEETGIYFFTRDFRNGNERMVKKRAKELNGKVDTLYHKKLNGIEICDAIISFKDDSLYVLARTFFKGNKQYEMEVLSKNKDFNSFSTKKYFNSFRFLASRPKAETGHYLKSIIQPVFYKNGDLYTAKVFFNNSSLYSAYNVNPVMRFKFGTTGPYEDFKSLIKTVGDTGYVSFVVRDNSVKVGEEKIKNWSTLVTIPLPQGDTSFILTQAYIVTK